MEIRPSIKWNKGHALEYLLDTLGFTGTDNVLPVYIGDDRTDEDAFKVSQIGFLLSSKVFQVFLKQLKSKNRVTGYVALTMECNFVRPSNEIGGHYAPCASPYRNRDIRFPDLRNFHFEYARAQTHVDFSTIDIGVF